MSINTRYFPEVIRAKLMVITWSFVSKEKQPPEKAPAMTHALPYRTGCATATPLSFSAFGRVYIIQVLTVFNSTRLGQRQD